MSRRSIFAVAIAAALAATVSAAAAAPSKVTLTFREGEQPASLVLRAPDGRLFEFSASGGDTLVDLTLFRQGHKPLATNLLEPKGAWSGVQPFGLASSEFDPGSQSAFGRSRDMPVRNYPLRLHVEVLEAESRTGANAAGVESEVFKKLVVTAELRPAK